MAAMKTPGVYIVEKNAFPSSVVEVATAVPAFIGYTQKAETLDRKPLKEIPHRITSMSEFIQHFGDAPPATFSLSQVTTPTDPPASGNFRFGDETYNLARVGTEQHYLLHHSMQFFFQNGGGPCYIVSVGSYEDDITAAALTGGLTPLVKEQEPTMVVIPEAVRLAEVTDCAAVQTQVLNHCAVVMKKSRFAILDVHDGDQDGAVDDFRENIGSENLAFGAAYYPWLNTTIVQPQDLSFTNLDEAGRTALKALIESELVPAAERAVTAADTALAAAQARVADADQEVTAANALEDGADKTRAQSEAQAKKEAADQAFANATAKKQAADAAATDKAVAAADKAIAAAETRVATAGNDQAKTEAANTALTEAQAAKAAAEKAVADRKAGLAAQLARIDSIDASDAAAVEQLSKDLRGISPKGYSTVINQMRAQLNVLPPAAAMAGIYTAVDNSRGVWKAPANVSVNSVVSPTVGITHDDQENLNVDVYGKSINAIRSFVGEGTLVWGGRTLDGNSLDWRYIQVRRTMIMLEESIRLASKAYVFEANDANTWVTIKSTIRNFLTGIWKRGGLAGASPDDAFQVFVGLGETMTPEDILEGILKVTVLVAPTRPAEFIEITFQQKMQES